jgi:selenocysteine lyase/cysteine desulfurase
MMPEPAAGSGATFGEAAHGYLDTPSFGLPVRDTVTAIESALADWYAARARFEDWELDAEACRHAAAGLLGARAADVALLASVVPAVAAVATALSRRSGRLLAHRAEFRSLLLPALAAFGEDRVDWVDGAYTVDTFTPALRPGASVLVSSISSADGARPDLAGLIGACAAAGCELVVDATQSSGIVGLGVDATVPAAVVAAGYKGLLGPRGVAYAVVRPDVLDGAVPTPSPYGMSDEQQVGPYGPPLLPKPGALGLDQSPAWLSWVGARPGLEHLAARSASDRERAVLAAATRLRSRLHDAGLPVQDSDLDSPVVSVALPAPEQARDDLARAGIRAAVRRGRLRMGFHLYNGPDDADLAADVLLGGTGSRAGGSSAAR